MSDVRPAWVFDDSVLPDPHGYGQRAVDFIAKLKHPKSRKPFQLDRWQERIVRRVYGTVDDGRRRIRTVYLRVGRGNRKTSLVAALGCLHTFGPERVPGGLGIAAAVDRDQAQLTWREATGLISMSPTLVKATEKREAPVFRIMHPKSGSVFEAVSSDGDSKHGRTPAFVVTDEIHAWQGRKLWAALTTGLRKIPGSLHWITTTAGAGQDGLAHQVEKYARDVASGAIEDPSFLPIIFETPEEYDWRDEAGWHLANPGLALGYPDVVGLRSLARQAQHVPAAKAEFEQYHLNRWQDSALSPWLDMGIYDQGDAAVDLDALEGEQCWVGVDYGAVHDLTAIVAVFPCDDGFHAACWAMVPEDGLRRKAEADGAPYPLWAEQGHIIPTEGNVVDRRVLADKLRELCERFSVQEISFDPYRMQDLAAELVDEGLPMVAFRQGWISMAPAVESVQSAILSGRFIHGGNPVLRWCFTNVVTRIDPAGNASFHKGRSRGRIDAAVAATMALHRASRGESGLSVYATDERPAGIMFI